MRNHGPMAVMEVCTFTAQEDDDAVRAADARFQTDFAHGQPGLLRRTTARGQDHRWCVVTLWATGEDADRAQAAAGGDEAASAFWRLVDPGSIRVERFTLLG